jgi:phosphoadenosine phosphosulfate reductase
MSSDSALQQRDPIALSTDELSALSLEFELLSASKIVQWAIDLFGPSVSIAASMTDAVLIDIATKIDPAIEVVFIDTGYHFPETLETVEAVRRRYGLNLRMMTVATHNEALWEKDPENCCSAVKVGQLDRALATQDAWMSGLRRTEAATRAHAPILSHDLRGLVKINPLACWSEDDVQAYIEEHDVPVNPLTERGYTSIGCQPCTKLPTGEDPRSGRWINSEKTECGLHY